MLTEITNPLAVNAARHKHAKYQNLDPTYNFVKFAVETAGIRRSEANLYVDA